MSIARAFHIIFYFSGIVTLMLGGYSLYMNPKARLNRAFAILALSLGIWAIGFSMAIDAANALQCLFWRRFAAVGWGTLFSLLLHFSLLFAGKESILKKRWLYPVIYAPAFLTLLIFSFWSGTAVHQYNLVLTSAGWTNKAYNNKWDIFYDVYYIVYLVVSLLILWGNGKKSDMPSIKKQIKLILASFFIAFFTGSLTDILCNSILSIKLPQMAPIIMLLPVFTVYYSMVRYGLMRPFELIDSEVILTESTRAKVYTNLSKALVAGGVLCFITLFISRENLFTSLFSSLFILLIGAVIQLVKYLHMSDYKKDILLIVIVFITIPSITLFFIPYAAVTIWAASFLFIVVAMVFNKPIVLISISVSILSTQVLIWIFKPQVSITISPADYVGRLGILIITIWFSYYVNNIYIGRLRKNADQLNLQRFISEVSSDFVNVNQGNIDEKMNWVIRILGKLFSIDTIHILLLDTEDGTTEYTNIWNSTKKITAEPLYNTTPPSDVAWLMNQFFNHESIIVQDIDKLPDKASEIRRHYKSMQIHSFVAIPIEEKGSKLRILTFSSVNSKKKWLDEELRVLNIISNLFDDAILKVEAEKEIFHMAYHDHLTGLPNRRLFRDRLTQAISLAERTEKMIGVIFIDLDSFKTINDTLGHEGGDSILTALSIKLTEAVRQSDTVSRFGGDEFLIMINNINSADDIHPVANKLLSILKHPFLVDGQEFNLTTSVGIALYPFDGTDLDSLIKNADIAMYKAKENGKNQYVICSSELKEEVLHKIRITNSLHRALDRGEFYVHYQPQVDLLNDKIIGLEALIRWRHPELGFVSPAVFIPIAEQIGMINEIGEWVLKTACRQNKLWQDEGYSPVCMAVNVSANQLRNPNFVQQINQALIETSLDPRFLEVEITESAAMNQTSNVVDFLNDIRSLGIKIAIDDFGTDYSSLSRLRELPIDKIKIDKQFIDCIEAGSGEKDQAIVRAIINLSKNLKLRVIAEGVEQKSQLDFLKQEQCDEIQGYYFYKPMSAEEISKLLRQD